MEFRKISVWNASGRNSPAGMDLNHDNRASATSTADTVLAVALFEIMAFANFVACYGLGLQRINTSLLWASPVPGTSTNQHLTVSVAVATYLIFH